MNNRKIAVKDFEESLKKMKKRDKIQGYIVRDGMLVPLSEDEWFLKEIQKERTS